MVQEKLQCAEVRIEGREELDVEREFNLWNTLLLPPYLPQRRGFKFFFERALTRSGLTFH